MLPVLVVVTLCPWQEVGTFRDSTLDACCVWRIKDPREPNNPLNIREWHGLGAVPL